MYINIYAEKKAANHLIYGGEKRKSAEKKKEEREGKEREREKKKEKGNNMYMAYRISENKKAKTLST